MKFYNGAVVLTMGSLRLVGLLDTDVSAMNMSGVRTAFVAAIFAMLLDLVTAVRREGNTTAFFEFIRKKL